MSIKSLLRVDEFGFEKYLKIRKKYEKSHGIMKQLHKNSWRRLMRRFNAGIPLELSIDKSVCFPHGISGIYISKGASIGKNCVIFQQVTIGSNTLSDSKNAGAPVIKDNCYIGAGAKIIGGVCIGESVRIGANCVVVSDVPKYSTVVLSNPVVITHNKERDNSFRFWE